MLAAIWRCGRGILISGEFIRRLDSPCLKKYASTAIGLVMAYVVAGNDVWHAVIVTGVNALIISTFPNRVIHGSSFVFSFFYLMCFRLAPVFGLPEPSGFANAVQMLHTLRVVGVALEVTETGEMKEKLQNSTAGENQDPRNDPAQLQLQLQHKGVHPSFLDIFHYCFCYIGLLTGPYYRFRTYWDMLHATDSQRSFIWLALQRVKVVPIYIMLFYISNYLFPLSFASNREQFEQSSLLYRLWYMTPIFFTMRMRFYAAFILSEVACMTAGLGAYPVSTSPRPGYGPTELQHLKTDHSNVINFETIHNIDEFNAEKSDFRISLRYWNMTVQFWLASNVYRRFPLKALRTGMTLFTSAIWHGVYAGYYLSFCSVPFIFLAEDMAKSKLRPLNPKIFDVAILFFKFMWYGYLGTAFTLQTMSAIYDYWKSILFFGHTIIPVIYIAGLLVPSPKPARAME